MSRRRRGRLFSRLFRPSERPPDSPGDSGYDSPSQLSPDKDDNFQSGQRSVTSSPTFRGDSPSTSTSPSPSAGDGDSDSGESDSGETSRPPVSATTRPSLPSSTSTPFMPFSSSPRTPLGTPRPKSSSGLPRPRPSSSLSLPDRFIPNRELSSPSSNTLSSPSSVRHRTATPVLFMTPSKRLLRHRGTAPDPFVFHSTAVVPKAHHYYPVIPRGGRPSLRRYVDDGSGGFLRSGTNAPFLPCHFPSAGQKFFENADKYERRLATALEIDPAARTLSFAHQQQTKTDLLDTLTQAKTRWNGTEWVNPGPDNRTRRRRRSPLSQHPFRVLDAPFIRDDYYSSILAYSATSQTLFIALFDRVYAWPEGAEGDVKRVYTAPLGAWVFSVAVSSYGGGKSILAVGCSNNQVILASPAETLPRFEVLVPAPVHCVSWRPTSTLRRSKHPSDPPRQVRTEDLLVGTSYGIIYYYVVEWPHAWEVERDNWSGAVSMVSRIVIHTDKICAIVWSPDGQQFASGANDNLCCLFEVSNVLPETTMTTTTTQRADGDRSSSSTVRRHRRRSTSRVESLEETSHAAALRDEKGLDGDGFEDEGFVDASFEDEVFAAPTAKETVKLVLPGSEKQWWPHDAAIKAIAFCPWQDGLVATGGGAEDRCIYFFHTRSGAALATIAVGAQVTGLVWSRTRREIAATLGFTNPERHPYRIAVFSWPECRLVGAIRREADYRILCAIHFPSQGQKDGPLSEDCIVVASSTHQVEFYNLWEAGGRRAVGGQGCLGGSDILESIEGIEKEGDVIR